MMLFIIVQIKKLIEIGILFNNIHHGGAMAQRQCHVGRFGVCTSIFAFFWVGFFAAAIVAWVDFFSLTHLRLGFNSYRAMAG